MTSSKYCKRVQEDELALALSETNSSTMSFKCNGCSKEFSQKNSLTSHKLNCHAVNHNSEASHSGICELNGDNEVINKLKCSICKQVFKKMAGLSSHKRACLLKHQVPQRSLVQDPVAQQSLIQDQAAQQSLSQETIESPTVQETEK